MSTIHIDNHVFSLEEAQRYLMEQRALHAMSCTLPLPPSVNSSYAGVTRYSADGKPYERRVASASVRKYKADTRYLLHQQGALTPIWQRAKSIGYYFTICVKTDRSDASNRIKICEDAVTEALGVDDHCVVDGHFTKCIDPSSPRIDMHWYIFSLEV